MEITKKARVIALYLPQYHPIPENDLWWGKGFTEWTNVGKAKPLFKGHIQPRVPADLGYYDLRLSEIRVKQAEMAKEAGIEGFCYWRYWFGNKKELLERPFNEMLKSKSPDFPFCVGWANHSWTNKSWSTDKKKVKEGDLIKQQYPGITDYIDHFNSLLPAFKDSRYIKVDGKPLFLVFKPKEIPNTKEFIAIWNSLAKENGLLGIHFVGIGENFEFKTMLKANENIIKIPKVPKSGSHYYNTILNLGFDAVNSRGLNRSQALVKSIFITYGIKIINKYTFFNLLNRYPFKKIIQNLYVEEDKWENVYPTIIPNFDRSPRSGKTATIWHGSTPKLFGKNIDNALSLVKDKKYEHKIIFLQSWNEWGEGNYVEPDTNYGKEYLNILQDKIF